MACTCQRRIAPKTYTNCTASPKHRIEDITYWDRSDGGGVACTGYKDVHLGRTTVKTAGNVCPDC